MSARFTADPRPVGGSLFRIHRDTRFSKDKSPYKTHLGLHFRHEDKKGAHAPGFYLHVDPAGSFFGLGIWHPDGKTLAKIRDAIVADPAGWKKATRAKRFTDALQLDGERLKRPPRGYDPDHELIEDLKYKDYCAMVKLPKKQVLGKSILTETARLARAGAPMAEFLCKAVGAKF